MRSRDTTPDAHAAQLAVYRRMTVDQKLALALAMSDEARQTSLDGIRARHPEYDDATAMRAPFHLVYGLDLDRQVWPHVPAPDPERFYVDPDVAHGAYLERWIHDLGLDDAWARTRQLADGAGDPP